MQSTGSGQRQEQDRGVVWIESPLLLGPRECWFDVPPRLGHRDLLVAFPGLDMVSKALFHAVGVVADQDHADHRQFHEVDREKQRVLRVLVAVAHRDDLAVARDVVQTPRLTGCRPPNAGDPLRWIDAVGGELGERLDRLPLDRPRPKRHEKSEVRGPLRSVQLFRGESDEHIAQQPCLPGCAIGHVKQGDERRGL